MVSQGGSAPTTTSTQETGHLLVVEDNRKMSSFIQQGFSEQGYQVDVADTGLDGEEKALAHTYDGIVLDVMLPDKDGVAVCKTLRERGLTTPILILTALSTTSDKVTGLDAGADDYLAKPFEFVELMARVRALLRRSTPAETSSLRFADVELDLLGRKVTRAGKNIKLTAREFSMLAFFMRHPEKVLSRAEIGENVWGMNFDAESNVIDVYVSMLRRKLDKESGHRLIHTVIGEGYTLSESKPTS